MTTDELIAELLKYPGVTVERYSDVHDVGTDITEVEFEPAKPARLLGGIKFGPDEAKVILR